MTQQKQNQEKPPEKKKRKTKLERLNDLPPFPLSFKILGKDDEHRFWFLPKNDPTPLGITKDQFNISTFGVLDSNIEFWQMYSQHLVVDSTEIEKIIIMFDLIARAEKKIFDIQALRGPGFWEDKGRTVYNDGRNIWLDSEKMNITDFKTEHIYIKNPSKRPDIINCDEATPEDGKKLMELFIMQNFDSTLSALALLGWTAIAPFSSLLYWRPHAWINADPGVGKTYLLFDIIGKILSTDSEGSCSGFAYASESGTTAAALRRKLGRMGFCAIIDELENNKTQRENVEKILELVHKSSSSKNGVSELVGKGGRVETYIVRQAFLLGSINSPNLQKAKNDRIIFIEMVGDHASKKEKISKTKKLMDTGFLKNNPQRFVARMYKRWKQFEQNLENITHAMMMNEELEQREIDLYAPCFAGVATLISDEVFSNEEEMNYFLKLMMIKKKSQIVVSDHHMFFDILFQSKVEMVSDGYRENVTIGSLMTLSNDVRDYQSHVIKALESIGIRIDGRINQSPLGKRIGVGSLYIHTKSKFISKQLMDEEIFNGGYSKLMKRHEAFELNKDGKKQHKQNIDGVTRDCLKFSLSKLTETYFSHVVDKSFLDNEKFAVPDPF
jgi:hypothetical protein